MAELPLERSPASAAPERLMSLDVFRGLVILAMLVVNNAGDPTAVGFWWKHADWRAVSLGADLAAWWSGGALSEGARWAAGGGSGTFPLLWHCTLADFVMPWFMLIIGVAMPFSVAAARAKGKLGGGVGGWYWAKVLRRGATLYVLGWIIGLSLQFLFWRFSRDPNAKLSFSLGMDVLQLLGVSYVVCRVVYCLPAAPRLAVAAGMLVWHWGFLRFWPQGEVPAGTFTAKDNAVGYAYRNWAVFQSVEITSWLRFGIAGMLSVPPAAATMVLGTYLGEVLRREGTWKKVWTLAGVGAVWTVIGALWSLDLPMNKPRWSPGYLVYCSGVGAVLLAVCYVVVDVWKVRGWTWPVVALGVNAIGIYFLSIVAKIWLLNMPKVVLEDGSVRMFTNHLVVMLQEALGKVGGSWAFTAGFVGVVWGLAMVAYWRRWVWKV
jgi:predicted acyltransferase